MFVLHFPPLKCTLVKKKKKVSKQQQISPALCRCHSLFYWNIYERLTNSRSKNQTWRLIKSANIMYSEHDTNSRNRSIARTVSNLITHTNRRDAAIFCRDLYIYIYICMFIYIHICMANTAGNYMHIMDTFPNYLLQYINEWLRRYVSIRNYGKAPEKSTRYRFSRVAECATYAELKRHFERPSASCTKARVGTWRRRLIRKKKKKKKRKKGKISHPSSLDVFQSSVFRKAFLWGGIAPIVEDKERKGWIEGEGPTGCSLNKTVHLPRAKGTGKG